MTMKLLVFFKCISLCQLAIPQLPIDTISLSECLFMIHGFMVKLKAFSLFCNGLLNNIQQQTNKKVPGQDFLNVNKSLLNLY